MATDLIIQGADIETADLKTLAKASGASIRERSDVISGKPGLKVASF